MTKRLIMIIGVSSELEADVDLEIIREFKDLMKQLKEGKSSGRTFMHMEYGGPNGDGWFKLEEVTGRGLQVQTQSDGRD